MRLIACFVASITTAAAAVNACSLLTPAEIERVVASKVTQKAATIVGRETWCTFEAGEQKVIVSFYTDPKGGPKALSMKDDPFMKGMSPGPNLRDFGTAGCKITDAGVLFSTACNRYQPRWLHLAVQTRGKTPIAMDAVKGLLDKAAGRFTRGTPVR